MLVDRGLTMEDRIIVLWPLKSWRYLRESIIEVPTDSPGFCR